VVARVRPEKACPDFEAACAPLEMSRSRRKSLLLDDLRFTIAPAPPPGGLIDLQVRIIEFAAYAAGGHGKLPAKPS
jgi:hypothetical protein